MCLPRIYESRVKKIEFLHQRNLEREIMLIFHCATRNEEIAANYSFKTEELASDCHLKCSRNTNWALKHQCEMHGLTSNFQIADHFYQPLLQYALLPERSPAAHAMNAQTAPSTRDPRPKQRNWSNRTQWSEPPFSHICSSLSTHVLAWAYLRKEKLPKSSYDTHFYFTFIRRACASVRL